MRYASRYIGVCLFFLCAHTQTHAQLQDDFVTEIANKMGWYATHQPSASLFVHFDKNIYTNNENVWFTGYLLKSTRALTEHFALCVALIRDNDRSVRVYDKFLMQNGLAFGSVLLPDSLPPGNYTFIAYTNRFVNGNPDNFFVQPITIKNSDTKFIASLQLIDSAKTGIDSIRVLLNARTKDIRMIADADVRYWMGDSLRGIVHGKIKTDRKGEVMITVPVKNVTADNFILTTEIRYGKELKTMRLPLPVYRNQPVIKLYPEGGNLIEGVPTLVGWEAKSAEGTPVTVNAVLYKNNKPVDTLTSNSYGIGRFMLIPDKGALYSLKTLNASGNDYPLPGVLVNGASIIIRRALTGDTLHTQVTTSYSGKIRVLVHNYKKIFLQSEIRTQARTARRVDFDLDEVPKGLTTVTVLDSNGAPLAERIFFAHYDRKENLTISTDSADYGQRQKVSVRLKLRTEKNEPIGGLVSVACVQDNRIDVRKLNDIESYLYLKNELATLPFKNNPMENVAENSQYLEDVLLIKGWRRYTWSDLQKTEAKDTLQQSMSLQFTGKAVSTDDSKIKKPLTIGFVKDGEANTFKTDSSGKFTLSTNQTVMSYKRTMMSVMGKDQAFYKVSVKDPYDSMNGRIKKELVFDNDIAVPQNSTQLLVLKSNEYAHTLPTVVVTSSSKDVTIFTGTCDDYVCGYNVLNCPNHHWGVKPRDGETYLQHIGGINYPVVYKGTCIEGEHILEFRGIFISKEFYGVDSTKTSSAEPVYLSTIYWTHTLALENGEAALSFYTGDITGRFRIIVQGITDGEAGVTSATHTFTVRP